MRTGNPVRKGTSTSTKRRRDKTMSNGQKVAIITGASQGIGAALVEAYVDKGYAVVANSRSIKPSSRSGIVTVDGDIGDRGVAERVVNSAIDRFGRIDTLINNAGIFIAKPFTDYSIEDFRNVIDVNVAGFFHISQLAAAEMLKKGNGHIVQITTALVDQPIAGVPSALASLTKGGLDAVTRSLAIEYAKSGIRVNAVAPGIVKTPMHGPETHEFLAGLHPVGRMGEITEIVDAVLYLEGASFVTGETLHVDGGQHAGRW
jgi:NAD(P)-dependent dehydrogenase (short-subunit alcohol dehydrogenase family)